MFRFPLAIYFLLITFLTGYSYPSNASDIPRFADTRFKSLSTLDGLSQDTVNSLAFDESGYLYIGTQNGLDRWDGYHIHPLTGSNNEFSDTSVQALKYHKNLLFVGTATKGMFVYNTKSGKSLGHVDLAYKSNTELKQPVISIEIIDAERILIAFDADVIVYNVTTRTYDTLYQITEQMFNNYDAVRWAIPFREHFLVATTLGLFVVDKDFNHRELKFLPDNFTHQDSRNVKHVFEDSQGNVWISTVLGLFKFPSNTLVNAISTAEAITAEPVLPTRNTWYVTEDVNHSIWIGTDMGVYRAGKGTNGKMKTEYLFEPKRGYEALSRKDIKNIAIDSRGDIWFGTLSSGVLYWSPLSEEFSILRNTTLTAESMQTLTNNSIWSIAESGPGQIWIGTENGLNLWDRTANTTQSWLKQDQIIDYSKSFLETVFVLDTQTLLLPTGDGIWSLDTQSGTHNRITARTEADQSVLNGPVYGTYLDEKHRLWFSSDSGYYAFDLNTQILTPIPLEEKLDLTYFMGFLGSNVGSPSKMFVSSASALWLLDTNTLSMTQIHKLPQTETSLHIAPSGVVLDAKGIMWIAYAGGGLYGLRTDTMQEVYHFDADSLLGTDMIYGIELDDQGYLWLSSAQGLHRLNIARTQVTQFVYGNILPIAEFNQSATLKLSDGSLAFGSPSGLLHFDPSSLNQMINERLKSNRELANINITEVSVDGINAREITHSINGSTLEIDHQDKGIQIRYSNMAFGSVSGQWYNYVLSKGKDIISQKDTQEALVSLPYLEPGEYTFSVYEKDFIAGQYKNSAQIKLSVAYPPWSSPIAIGSYVAISFILVVMAISIRKKQLSALNRAKLQSSMFGEAFRQTRDCVVLLNSDKEAFASNDAFNNVFGIHTQDSLNSDWQHLLAEHLTLQQCVEKQLNAVTVDKPIRKELQLCLNQTEEHDFLVKASIIDGARFGKDLLYMLIFSDISEQKNTQRKLIQIATHDTLTGLANRQLLMDRLEHAIQHAHHHQRQLAVMFIDLDRFKAINDSLGHDMGDALLTELSKRMQAFCPADMTLARVGGDEFVAIAEDIASIDEVTSFAYSIIELVEKPVLAKGEKLRVSCSIGAAIYPEDADSSDALLRFADLAMYSAKKDPITPFCFYTKLMNEAAHDRLQLENLVKTAFESNSFYNVYQPIIDINQQKTVGFELLMRCRFEKQFLSPAEFVPVLEQLRLIVDATKRAVHEALKQVALWYEQGFDGYLSVNLSALHFSEDIDIQFFEKCLTEHQLPKSALRFEVTENVLMADKDQALKQFQRLKHAGFKLALDDFGTGYSSLGYLRSFPFDVIKIDKSFCDDIETSSQSRGLVSTTISMAQSLSMGCVAEGIETREQVEFLRHYGCALHQGYFFSRPVGAKDAQSLASKNWVTEE